MTSSSTDRLDRIEVLLAQLAESQQRTQQHVDANSTAMAEMREEMRLADERSRQRLQETTAGVTEMISAFSAPIGETREIADSNARAIQAWGERINELQEETEEATSTVQANVGTLSRMIQGLVVERREDWRQWRDQWQEWRQEWQEWQAQQREEWQAQQQAWQVRQAESDQRFENLLQDAREDRRRNEAEHNAFRENIQTMLLEISRLWQRLAG